MSKADELLHRMGNGLAESIGIRAGHANHPSYTSGGPPRTDFVRNRSVGEIHPSEVIPDPNQPRKHFSDDELEQLAADIRHRGQLQPIRVRWSGEHGKWLIIAGERRWRAITKSGLDKVTCIFIDREMSESEIRAEQLVENLLREDLNGMEQAKSFKALMDLNGWNATELSQNINVSKGKVSKALSLLKLPEDLQDRIQSGELSPSTAYELAKVKDQKEQQKLADKAVAGELSQPEAAKATKRSAAGAPKKRSTNESFRTSDNVRITIAARRDIGDEGMIAALIEIAESIRKRGKKAA